MEDGEYQALDSGVGADGLVVWNRNMNEALIVWEENEDVKARKLMI